MTQSFEDFLIPSGYIKLHQVTSSCINQKKKQPTAKEKRSPALGCELVEAAPCEPGNPGALDHGE
jgi:hypothetical protein